MSPVDEILAQVPLGDLAARLGVDEATAEHAARQALPALLGGIQANAEDPAGAASLAHAVQQHDSGLIDGGVDLGQVDTSDGDRIVGHVFGEQRPMVVNQLGGLGPLGGSPGGGAAAPGAQGALGGQDGSGLIAKLLPILAPIVMSYLAKKVAGGSAGTGGLPGSGAGSGGGLGDLLGGILGGAGGRSGQGGILGGGLGDLLGGLLGGGRRSP
ncbi:DUF937 domain-containing protein [Pseudonocardia halophobica]|uniref:DUF937 domain-containing protein n=1 Tax=Pseudonocardia halophobica TaxID=29401 RepID=UPI003D8BFBE8